MGSGFTDMLYLSTAYREEKEGDHWRETSAVPPGEGRREQERKEGEVGTSVHN